MNVIDEDSNGPSPNKRIKLETCDEKDSSLKQSSPCRPSEDGDISTSSFSPGKINHSIQKKSFIKKIDDLAEPIASNRDDCSMQCSVDSNNSENSQSSDETCTANNHLLQLELAKAFDEYHHAVQTTVAEVTVETYSDESKEELKPEKEEDLATSKIIEILSQDGEKVCSIVEVDENIHDSQSEDPLGTTPCAPMNSPMLNAETEEEQLENQLSASTVAQVAAILNPHNCFLEGLEGSRVQTISNSQSHPGYVITGDQLASLSTITTENPQWLQSSLAQMSTSQNAPASLLDNHSQGYSVIDSSEVVVLPEGYQHQVYYQSQSDTKESQQKKMVTSQTTMPCASRNLSAYHALMKNQELSHIQSLFSSPHTPASSLLRTSTPLSESVAKRNIPSYLTPQSVRGMTTPLSRMSQLSLNSSGSEEERSPAEAFSSNVSFRMPHVPFNTPVSVTVNPLQPASTIPSAAELNRALSKTKKDSLSDNYEGPGREQHNAKERARRARIKTACDDLRELMPGNTARTDKATLMELSVEYIKHLRGIVGEHYDKEFLKKTATYMNMEME